MIGLNPTFLADLGSSSKLFPLLKVIYILEKFLQIRFGFVANLLNKVFNFPLLSYKFTIFSTLYFSFSSFFILTQVLNLTFYNISLKRDI